MGALGHGRGFCSYRNAVQWGQAVTALPKKANKTRCNQAERMRWWGKALVCTRECGLLEHLMFLAEVEDNPSDQQEENKARQTRCSL